MTVWMYIDPFTSMTADDKAHDWNEAHPGEKPKTSQDVEYEEIEDAFKKAFPDCAILFCRDKLFPALSNGNPDYYVWDIGGMCYTDHSGTQRGNFSYEVIRQLEDHPNTMFVPWSAFTHNYAEGALCDLLGDDCLVKGKLPHNIVILDSEDLRKRFGGLEEEIMSRLKKAYQERG